MDTSVENPYLYVAPASEFPDCGFRIADWTARGEINPQSKIRNPQLPQAPASA